MKFSKNRNKVNALFKKTSKVNQNLIRAVQGKRAQREL